MFKWPQHKFCNVLRIFSLWDLLCVRIPLSIHPWSLYSGGQCTVTRTNECLECGFLSSLTVAARLWNRSRTGMVQSTWETSLYALKRKKISLFSRSVCWGRWLLVSDDRSESQSLLSTTIGQWSADTDGWHDLSVDEWNESTSESRSTLSRQHLIGVHVVRKTFLWVSSQQETYSISSQCSSSSSINIQRLLQSPYNTSSSSSSAILFCLSIQSYLSSHPSNLWLRSGTQSHRGKRISRDPSRWLCSIKMDKNFLCAHPSIIHSNCGFHGILTSTFHRCICRMLLRSDNIPRPRRCPSICIMSI